MSIESSTTSLTALPDQAAREQSARSADRRIRVHVGLAGIGIIQSALSGIIVSDVAPDSVNSIVGLLLSLSLCAIASGVRTAITVRTKTAFGLLPLLVLQLSVLLSSFYYLLLQNNIPESKLYRLGVEGLSLTQVFSSGYGLLTLASAVGTVCGSVYYSDRSHLRGPLELVPSVYWSLATLGAFGLALRLSTSRADAFADRGEAVGEGLVNLVFWGGPVAVAYGIIGSHGGSRTRAAFSLLMIAAIFVDGNRSPLLFILVALAVRLFARLRAKYLLIAFSSAFLGLFVFALQSTWRGLLRDGGNTSLLDAVRVMGENPTRAVLRAGFDTLEGTGLTQYLLVLDYRPEWWDPAVAVLNFVPRALWASKPGLFGSEIGVNVLGFEGAGGIFLSGPGYLLLWIGNSVGAILAFGVITAACVFMCSKISDRLLIVIVITTFLRFLLAGDPFDIFLGLQAAILYLAARYFFARSEPRGLGHGSNPYS